MLLQYELGSFRRKCPLALALEALLNRNTDTLTLP